MTATEPDLLAGRLEGLFEAHSDAVWRYALRRVGEDAARDVVAETFLVAWRRIETLPEPALPWLYGVARNVIANAQRGARRADALRARMSSEPPGEADTDAAAAIRAAIASLPEPDRELIRLTAWEGLSREEAAIVLRCPAATVRVRLHRARRRLRRELARQGVPVDDRPPRPVIPALSEDLP